MGIIGCRGSIENSDKFYQVPECKYFPCHETKEELNCKFCYCPLYLVENCGGNYAITEDGIKDCTDCTKPHEGLDGYYFVINKLDEKVF